MEVLKNSEYQDTVNFLWRIYTTTLEMLADRGYEVPEFLRRNEQELRNIVIEEEDEISFLNTRKMEFTLEHSKKEKGKISVFFIEVRPTLNLAVIRKLLQTVGSDENDKIKHRTIIVSSTPPTAGAKKFVNLEDFVELFLFTELSFNVTKHCLVPKHEVISRKNKAQVLRELNVKENQLPKLLTTDPVARYFRMTKGKLVKITRSCSTIEKFVTYRIVTGE